MSYDTYAAERIYTYLAMHGTYIYIFQRYFTTKTTKERVPIKFLAIKIFNFSECYLSIICLRSPDSKPPINIFFFFIISNSEMLKLRNNFEIIIKKKNAVRHSNNYVSNGGNFAFFLFVLNR